MDTRNDVSWKKDDVPNLKPTISETSTLLKLTAQLAPEKWWVGGWEMIRLPLALGHIFRGGSPLVSARVARKFSNDSLVLFDENLQIWGWIFGSMQS